MLKKIQNLEIKKKTMKISLLKLKKSKPKNKI